MAMSLGIEHSQVFADGAFDFPIFWSAAGSRVFCQKPRATARRAQQDPPSFFELDGDIFARFYPQPVAQDFWESRLSLFGEM